MCIYIHMCECVSDWFCFSVEPKTNIELKHCILGMCWGTVWSPTYTEHFALIKIYSSHIKGPDQRQRVKTTRSLGPVM